MIELRQYVPAPGKAAELKARFENGTLALFAKLGIKVVDFWEKTDGSGELWYTVEWPDEATMKATWDAFRRDPEWQELKARTEAEGPLATAIVSIPLQTVVFGQPGE